MCNVGSVLRICALSMALSALLISGTRISAQSGGCYDSGCQTYLDAVEDQGCSQGCSASPVIPQVVGSSGSGTDHLCPANYSCTGSPTCTETVYTEEVIGNPACCTGAAICTDISCGNYNPGDPSCCTDACNPDCTNYDPCSSSSCSGYDVCACVGTCADSSCPGYDPCTCE